MKNAIIFFTSLLVSLVNFNFSPLRATFTTQPVIVAELFTSEGCSSCPAADALLKEMVELTAKEGKSVLALAFHITYWNHLGWQDPYSQGLFTNRQKKYVEKLNTQQLYTPQVVVNGEYEFVGSNPVAFRYAIEKAWSKPAVYQIDGAAHVESNELIISYSLNKEPKTEWLNVALVETSIVNQVSRGENKNRTLKHYNVVRKFETVPAKRTDKIKIAFPENFDSKSATVILYVQHSKNYKIGGAVKIGL